MRKTMTLGAAGESGGFDAAANALELRLFNRRVRNPAKTLERLRRQLQTAGFNTVAVAWVGADAHFSAVMSQRFSALVNQAKHISPYAIIYSRIVTAAREIGFQIGVEDLGLRLDGEKVSRAIRAVPFHEMTTALDKLWEALKEATHQRSSQRKRP